MNVQTLDLMSSSPLRGRRSELERAGDVLEETAATGQASAILISGAPGIGKSAVLDRIVQGAENGGFAVGRNKADEADQIAPMALLLLALRQGANPLVSRQAFSDLAPLRDQPLWLIDQLIAILEERSMQTPVLIALDDVQWADRLTLSCLRLMPARLVGSPIVWALSVRADTRSLADVRATLVRDLEHVEELRLAPLDERTIEDIANVHLGAPPDARTRLLLKNAGGNPFLAVELLHGIVEGARDEDDSLPQRLRASVQQRVETLGPGAVTLLRFAAVLGRPFSIADAVTVLEASPQAMLEALAAAVRGNILVESATTIAFKHDLLRQAIYEETPPSLRLALHRAIAAHLLETAGPIDATSHVLASASVADRGAADVVTRAATAVLSATPAVAAELVMKAFALILPSDPNWLDVGLTALSILIAARRPRDAVALADRLLAAEPTNPQRAEIQSQAARALWEMGSAKQIVSRADATLALIGLSGSARAELLAHRAIGLARVGSYETAIAAGQNALDESRREGNAGATTLALRALADASTSDGRYVDALNYVREIDSAEDPIGTICQEVMLLQQLDRYDECRALLARGYALADGSAPASDLVFAQLWLEYTSANFHDAEALALTLVRECDEVHEKTYEVEGRLLLARVTQARGDYAAAHRHLDLAAETKSPPDDTRRMLRLVANAWLCEAEEDLPGALACVREVVHSEHGVRHRWRWQSGWLALAARCAALGGDSELGRELAASATALGERNPNVASIVGLGHYARGLATADLSALELAIETFRASPRPTMLADAQADYGRELLRRGQRRLGLAALREAARRFESLGAFSDAERAQRSLLAAGVRARKPQAPKAVEGWDSLTKTERKVARLIVDGHTNRSAAKELALSPNTISTHLRSVFGKLAVNSRVQLARLTYLGDTPPAPE
jgi:DNA-binding CsgD family transcriptional regulator/tetratricopeptide (TPR) repeat protein